MTKPKTEDNLPSLRSFAAERTRGRFWQDVQLAAVQALIAANPPSPDSLAAAPHGMVEYAREINRAAFAIADEAVKQHGPSISARLQGIDPFIAAPGVKEESAEESAD